MSQSSCPTYVIKSTVKTADYSSDSDQSQESESEEEDRIALMPGNGYQKHNKSKNTPREVLAVTDLRRFKADIIKRTKDLMSRLDKLEQAGQEGVVFEQNDVGKNLHLRQTPQNQCQTSRNLS